MKRFRIIAVLAMSIFMIIGSMSAFAYDYKVTVSAGNGTPGTTFEGKKASINVGDSTVTIDDGTPADISAPSDNHVMIGYKVAGRDNSEVINADIEPNNASSFIKNQDVDLVVAYALESDLAKYEIRYQDAGGAELLPTETHYGADGSRQVVSFKHVEGYLPNTYNYVGTLKKGDSTVFTFIYNEVVAEDNVTTITQTTGGGGAAGAGGAGAGGAGAGGAAGGAAGAGADGATIGDGATPTAEPQDVVDIDNPETPTTDQADDAEDIEDSETPGTNWAMIGGGAALVAAIAAAAIVIARRKREEADDEDDE